MDSLNYKFENLKQYNIINELNHGESSVKKILLEKDNKKYLLRLYDLKFIEGRYTAFKYMDILYKNGINVPQIYDQGILNDIKKGYAILEWIDGIPLNNLLFNNENCIKYGELVATQLKKIHQNELNRNYSFDVNFLNSLENKILKLKNLNVNIDYKFIYKYVYENIKTIRNKNLSVIHGDLHPGNIIVNNNSKIYFIDLDVCKKDFSWIDLITNSCNMDYPKFYESLIAKYFNEEIPNDFWKAYNLYGTLYCLDYILYCNRTLNKTISDGIDTYQKFLDFTNKMNNNNPKWFNNKYLRKEL